jgi:integrase
MATFRKRGLRWFAEVKLNGVRRGKTFDTKAQAKNWAAAEETRINSLGAGVSQTHTLGDVMERYLSEVSPTKRGAKWESNRIIAYLRHEISTVKLMDLKREHFEDLIEERLKSVKPSTVNRDLNLISNCLTYARRWRLMDHNPFDDLKRPTDPKHRERLISVEEIEEILISLGYVEGVKPTLKQHYAGYAFLFAIETAMRLGELTGLRPEDVNLTKRVAHLPLTKNGSARSVPLSSRAVQLLTMLKPWEHETIFQMSSEQCGALFRKGLARTRIEDLTFHDTRHEAITRLARKVEVLDLARIVGHKDIKMLMRYYNRTAEDIAAQLD